MPNYRSCTLSLNHSSSHLILATLNRNCYRFRRMWVTAGRISLFWSRLKRQSKWSIFLNFYLNCVPFIHDTCPAVLALIVLAMKYKQCCLYFVLRSPSAWGNVFRCSPWQCTRAFEPSSSCSARVRTLPHCVCARRFPRTETVSARLILPPVFCASDQLHSSPSESWSASHTIRAQAATPWLGRGRCCLVNTGTLSSLLVSCAAFFILYSVATLPWFCPCSLVCHDGCSTCRWCMSGFVSRGARRFGHGLFKWGVCKGPTFVHIVAYTEICLGNSIIKDLI